MSDWIKFLRKYGPIPQNDNMYDESIQRASKRLKFHPITFQSPYLNELKNNYTSDTPQSIILTGTAGDGKTYLCRKIWEYLDGDADEWNSDKKVQRLLLNSGKELIVIKDLSELKDDEKRILIEMAKTFYESSQNQLYLIAANDGQLVEALEKVLINPNLVEVRTAIEDALVTGSHDVSNFPLQLFNLSLYKSTKLLNKVLDAVIDHPGWKHCEDCQYSTSDLFSRCPIWENLQRISTPLFRKRLSSLLNLCDHNGIHIPIRQLLLLITNALLGHPDTRDQLMNCSDIPKLSENGKTWNGNIYTNIFGTNLKRRRLPHIFEVLKGFGIGEETSNRIDYLLVFGNDDPAEKQKLNFNNLIGNDQYYGANKDFIALQNAYIEGEDNDAAIEFIEALVKQRQRLFFTIPEIEEDNLRFWELSVFHYAGEYLDEVVGALESGNCPPSRIISRLTRGLNRIFTGVLTSSNQNLWLASSGSFSQSRISKMVEGKISVLPNKGEFVAIDKAQNGMVLLVVNIDLNISASLPLHLTRYEFLSRVAEGALPSSFSRECYEDILSFKSQVLSKYNDVQLKYGPPQSLNDEMRLRFLDLDPHNQLIERQVVIKLKGRI